MGLSAADFHSMISLTEEIQEAYAACSSTVSIVLALKVFAYGLSAVSTGIVLGSRMDTVQDKLLYTIKTECNNSKTLDILGGISSFYWWHFFSG